MRTQLELPSNYRNLEATYGVRKSPEHDRYHEWQQTRETAAKRLAKAAGYKVVACPCGQEFPA